MPAPAVATSPEAPPAAAAPENKPVPAKMAAAVEGADLLVSNPLAYAARLVAEKKRVPWVSTMLVPVGFFSAYDGTVLPLPAALSAPLSWLGPRGRW